MGIRWALDGQRDRGRPGDLAEHRGRAAGGVCDMLAREKGTRDEWNCHRILQYSQGLVVLAASKNSFSERNTGLSLRCGRTELKAAVPKGKKKKQQKPNLPLSQFLAI